MKYITFLNILAKLVFTVAIFIFIHKASDHIYVPLINSWGSIVVGVLALWMVSKYFDARFVKPTIESIKYQLREGWHIFISTVAISLYKISNTFILGLLTDNTIVGYYAAAEKIIKVVQGLLSPISQTVFPYISKLSNESKERSFKVVKKLFIFAESIVNMLLGNQYQKSIVVLRILSFLPFIIALSTIYAVQGLISLGSSKVIPKIVFSGALLNIFALPVLTYFYKDMGIAISWVLTEIFITFLSFKYFRRLYHHDWKVKKIY